MFFGLGLPFKVSAVGEGSTQHLSDSISNLPSFHFIKMQIIIVWYIKRENKLYINIL